MDYPQRKHSLYTAVMPRESRSDRAERAVRIAARYVWAPTAAGFTAGGTIAAFVYGNAGLGLAMIGVGLTEAFLGGPILNAVYSIAQATTGRPSHMSTEHPHAFFYRRFPTAQSCTRPDEPKRRVLHPKSLSGAFRSRPLEERL